MLEGVLETIRLRPQWLLVLLSMACATWARSVDAQIVWSGPTVTFNKPEDGDPTLPENQDRLTDNVWLTRGFPSSGGLFNIKLEEGFSRDIEPVFYPSPRDTEWATDLVGDNAGKMIAASNYQNLDFTTWAPAFGGPGFSLSSRILSLNAVVHLITDDIYFDIQFTEFGSGYNTYERSSPGTATEPTGDYNSNLVVDAADYTIWRDTLGQLVANPGDGADGDKSGEVDPGDYDHWKAHFGEVVPLDAGGQAGAVPEPSTILLLLSGLLIFANFQKFTPRGPGQTF